MGTYTLFKTNRKMGDNQQTYEELNNKFGEKYKVEFHKAGNGAMKFITGNTTDYVTIKKNAYHAVTLGVSPADPTIDYHTITVNSYIPNMLVKQTIGDRGLVNILVAKIIWGNGTAFYDEIDNFIMSEYEGTSVDTGLANSVKQMFKGKSVLDD